MSASLFSKEYYAAREFLAVEMERAGRKGTARKLRSGQHVAQFREEIAAVAAALRHIPAGFTLVPLTATERMCKAADGIGALYACNAGEVWDAILAARPDTLE